MHADMGKGMPENSEVPLAVRKITRVDDRCDERACSAGFLTSSVSIICGFSNLDVNLRIGAPRFQTACP